METFCVLFLAYYFYAYSRSPIIHLPLLFTSKSSVCGYKHEINIGLILIQY